MKHSKKSRDKCGSLKHKSASLKYSDIGSKCSEGLKHSSADTKYSSESFQHSGKSLRYGVILLGAVLACLCLSLASLWLGSKQIPVSTVAAALRGERGTTDALIVAARIPRTIFGLLAGSALAVSGVLMQATTRNPIADPSILGVTTGASLAVVLGFTFWHTSSSHVLIWLAMLGACVAAVIVYGVAQVGSVSSLKLALSGTALSSAFYSIMMLVLLPNIHALDKFRFWQVGSIGKASFADIRAVLPYLLLGMALAFRLANDLNALSMGDEVAAGLGVRIRRTRLLAALSSVLLCASITAVAGPIGFIGLVIPHFVRLLINYDYRVVLPFSCLFGSCLLLLADIAGRLVSRPTELESGILTAMFGAPIFLLVVVRRVKR